MTVKSEQTITLSMMREKLYTAVVCDALDSLGFENQSPRVQLKGFTTAGLLVGRAKTTVWVDYYHEEENPYELELRAVDTAKPDDVIVCAVGGSMRSAVWGELLSTASKNSGAVGAIVDGAVRDVEKMRAMPFPVYALGTSPYDSKNRQRVVDLDVRCEIAGVAFRPGELVFADVDGVVVVPAEVEDEALRRAWDKVHTENEIRDSIRGGMKATSAFEKYGVL